MRIRLLFSHRGTVVLCDIHVSACVYTCCVHFGLFFPVGFVLSCLFFLMLQKACERTEREFKSEKEENGTLIVDGRV